MRIAVCRNIVGIAQRVDMPAPDRRYYRFQCFSLAEGSANNAY